MDFQRGRTWLTIGVLAAGTVSFARADDGPAAPATQPAVTPDEQKLIDRAIAELGSGSFAAREQAAKALWTLGDKSVASLKDAARGDDPETAGRARALLENFSYGVRPDTPKAVLDLIGQYKNAGPDLRPAIARALAEQDVAGPRVLVKIARDEKDPDLRQAVLEALVGHSRPAAAKLLAEGDEVSARQILQAVSGQHEAAARDWAAFVSMHGGIGEEIRKLQQLPPKADAGQEIDFNARLAFLLRANGDIAGAARAAGKGDDPTVAESLLAEAGEWKTLATRMEARGVDTASVEDMAYANAYHRLSGNQAGADKWAAELVKYTDDNPATHWDAAEALLLNDQVDRAIQVLTKRRNQVMAVEFLSPRLQFAEVMEQVNQAKADGSLEMPRLRAKSAAALHFFGKKKEAEQAIEAAASGEGGVADYYTFLDVLEASRAINQPPEKTDEWVVAGLKSIKPNRPQEQPTKIFQKAGFDREDQAAGWWLVMRDLHNAESPAASVARIRQLDRKELPEADLKKLIDQTSTSAAQLPLADRDTRLKLVADTLADLDKLPEAIEVLEKLTTISEAATILDRLGELYADAKKWDKAADAFGRTFDRDRSQASPLLMRGYCLVQTGQEKEGRALMETAHRMPLANEAERHEILTMLLKRGMKDEARRERDILLRTAELSSWERGDAVRRAAEEALDKNDYLVAADLWDQAFLHNLNTRVSFVEPQANLMIPVLTHRVRAQGLVKANRAKEAVEQAEICFKSCPGDADSQIDIILALSETNHNAEADAVYAMPKALYSKMAADYPDSASAHNLLAWFSGRCHRDLEEALVHAKRATELEPNSPAIMDTLAEVYFQRGDIDQAIDLVRRCLKLEPMSEHHKKNLDRFLAAKGKASAAPAAK